MSSSLFQISLACQSLAGSFSGSRLQSEKRNVLPSQSFRTGRLRASANADEGSKGGLSRRQAIQTALLAGASLLLPLPAVAGSLSKEGQGPREALLEAVKAKSGVQEAIDRLAEFNPTLKPNKSSAVFGKWKLLWSSDAAEVSKALSILPIPAKSFQLIGEAGGVEKGRAANLIDILNGTVVIRLNSSCVPDEESTDTFIVGPPFKLEVLVAGKSIPITEVKEVGGGRSGPLGDELNKFEQVYLEDSGKPGDLRISRVRFGDKQVVGSVFVHERV